MSTSRTLRRLPLALAIGLAAGLPLALASPAARPAPAHVAKIDIPFQQFTLATACA